MPKLTQAINPPTLVKPAGYSHGWETQGGKTVYIAGQVAVDKEGHVVGAGDLVAQFRQVCENLKAVLVSRAGQMNDIVKLTIYVLSKSDYKTRARDIGAVYRDYFGRHYPAMTAVQVVALIEDQARVEIEVTAVRPARG